jgi:hypothetical protein
MIKIGLYDAVTRFIEVVGTDGNKQRTNAPFAGLIFNQIKIKQP